MKMKKSILLLALFSIIFGSAMSQVAVNADGSAPSTSAILDIKSTSKGMLVPRMTTTQRTAISSPANGLMVFDTQTTSFWFYNVGSSGWIELIGGNNIAVLSDSDSDTKIQLEESSNDNLIRFDMAGIEYFVMDNGRLAVKNTNASVVIGDSAGLGNNGLFTANNTFIGFKSGQESWNCIDNTALGYKSFVNNTLGDENTAIGAYSLLDNVNGNKNTAVGYKTLKLASAAHENTAVGYSALLNSTGGRNTAVGSQALYTNGNGNYNNALGYKSAYSNTTGSYNTSIGDSSLYSNTTGYLNTAIGHGAMFANTTTWHSVAVGTAAMKNTNGGADNTAVGDSALFSNVSGSYNTALGNSALQENLGSRNTAIGNDALRNNYGSSNTAIGHEALIKNTSGYSNVAVGGYALADVTTGYNNTIVGNNSGRGIKTGNYNTIIGAEVTGLSADMNSNIIIADGEGIQRIRINEDGDVGIGTYNPTYKLHVYSSSAAEPIAQFQSYDDVSIRVNGQGGESYVEIENDDTGTGNSWKVGLNDNTKLSIQYGTAGTMNSNTEALKISTAGYIYKPKMPYFFVEGGTIVVSTGSSSSVVVDFNTEKFDNGNNFDLSTNKFTAPVHGIYTFSWDISHSSGQDMGGALGYFHPGYLETSESSTADIYWLFFQETSERNGYTMSGIVELNSGEHAWISSKAYDDFEISNSRFSGYLVTALE